MVIVGKIRQFLMKQYWKKHNSQTTNNFNRCCPVKASNPGVWDKLYAADNNKSQHSSNRQAKQSHFVFVGSELFLIVFEAAFQQNLFEFVKDLWNPSSTDGLHPNPKCTSNHSHFPWILHYLPTGTICKKVYLFDSACLACSSNHFCVCLLVHVTLRVHYFFTLS